MLPKVSTLRPIAEQLPSLFLGKQRSQIGVSRWQYIGSLISFMNSGVYSFSCDTEEAYGCTTVGSSGQTWPGRRTDLSLSTEAPDHYTVGGGDVLHAWGIRILAVSDCWSIHGFISTTSCRQRVVLHSRCTAL